MTHSEEECRTNFIIHEESVVCAGSDTSIVGICFGDSGGKSTYNHFRVNLYPNMQILYIGPLTVYNGTHTILIGVTSYVAGTCGSLTNSEGFAKVSHVLPWIRETSDDWVKDCSGLLGEYIPLSL